MKLRRQDEVSCCSPASLPSSAAEVTPSLIINCARNAFTVRRLIRSSSAICLLSLPATMRSKTSRSRSVSAARRVFRRTASSRTLRCAASRSSARRQRIEQRVALDRFSRKSTAPAFIARTLVGTSA
jgi:hypothetical protein